ncbi:MAG: hypothetical protein GY822_11780 [Deltaproteobacteria bacterium]|nr:hypothetical protein [Deltaproteobacteria bacterium]
MNSMTSAQPDIDLMWDLLQDGQAATGNIQVVIGDKDPSASPEKAAELGQLLDNVDVKLVRSDNHVFEQSGKEMASGLDALSRLLAD